MNNTTNNNNNNGRSFNKKKKKLVTNQQTLGAAWGSNSLSSSRLFVSFFSFFRFRQITSKCLPAILKLQHLEELVLEGCFGIDDDSLATLKQESKSLKILDMSSIQNVSHVGLSSLTNGIGCLQQLTLAYGSLVTLDLARSLQRLSKLQSIKLDGCAVTCSGLQAIGNGCCDTFSNRDLFPSPGKATDNIINVLNGQRIGTLFHKDAHLWASAKETGAREMTVAARECSRRLQVLGRRDRTRVRNTIYVTFLYLNLRYHVVQRVK
ncbi:hypothetical protein RND81_01G034500 [Saponaria officinalis]|uniref:Uncharacterized protein n=1 Tax=Saponaria officinalis TaxID=3572 RepID=A0AAW1N5H6_SAPOF